jgi:hypothetical protein
MDKNRYNDQNHLDGISNMNKREALEARIFDALESTITEDAQTKLLEDLAAFPDLKEMYLSLISSDEKQVFMSAIPKAAFEEVGNSVLDASLNEKLAKQMDEEAFWLSTIPQIKGIIYKFVMPVMAASLFLFFQFGEQSISNSVSIEQELIENLTGYSELSAIQENVPEYATLGELDALIAELNQTTTSTNSTDQ